MPPGHIIISLKKLTELERAARVVPPGHVVVPTERLNELEEDSNDFMMHLGQFEQGYTDKVLKALEEVVQKKAKGKPKGRPRKVCFILCYITSSLTLTDDRTQPQSPASKRLILVRTQSLE